MNTARLVPLVGALALIVAACTSGGAPASGAPSASPPASAAPSPSDSAPPDTGVTDPGGSGGGVPGDPGGQAKQVSIWPNAQDPRDAVVTTIIPALNGRKLAVQLEWWSGVEPCNVLAGFDIQRPDPFTFQITVREGTGDPNAMCIEIAELHAAIVDLGEVAPGTYTIMAKGEAAPVEVVVS